MLPIAVKSNANSAAVSGGRIASGGRDAVTGRTANGGRPRGPFFISLCQATSAYVSLHQPILTPLFFLGEVCTPRHTPSISEAYLPLLTPVYSYLPIFGPPGVYFLFLCCTSSRLSCLCVFALKPWWPAGATRPKIKGIVPKSCRYEPKNSRANRKFPDTFGQSPFILLSCQTYER